MIESVDMVTLSWFYQLLAIMVSRNLATVFGMFEGGGHLVFEVSIWSVFFLPYFFLSDSIKDASFW